MKYLISSYVAATQCIKACRRGQDVLLKFTPSIRTGEDRWFIDFEHSMVAGARQADLSISENADLLGFSHTTISRVYREQFEEENTSSERQCSGRKCLVVGRGQRTLARLVWAGSVCTVSARLLGKKCWQSMFLELRKMNYVNMFWPEKCKYLTSK